jgi:hypothetical protein
VGYLVERIELDADVPAVSGADMRRRLRPPG